MAKSKMKTVKIIGGITAFILIVVLPAVLGIMKFSDYKKKKETAVKEQKLIYETLSSRMLKELGLVKDNSKYYISNIDEKLSKKEMTVKELSKINIEMQELLRNKELLMKNKKIIEETQKLYQRLKNFSFKEHILLKKEEFENFDNYLYQVEKISESLKEYYENGEIFDFEDRKSRFDTEYKKWTGEETIVYEEFLEKAFSVFREKQNTSLKEMCTLWSKNEPYLKKEEDSRNWNIVFKEKTFIFRPNDDAINIPEEKIHSFLCEKN
jgi:hypothetical protein